MPNDPLPLPLLPPEHTAAQLSSGPTRIRDYEPDPRFAEVSTLDGKTLALLKRSSPRSPEGE